MANPTRMIVRAFTVLCALAAGSVFAASTGSCMSKAGSISVGATKTVTLVQEYYGDGEYGDSGVYYLKVKLSKYNEYTVTARGCDGMYVDTDGDDENAPMSSFSEYEVGDSFYSVLTEWDDDDPSSGTFYIVVDGSIGDKAVISVSDGNNLPIGIPDNPKSITVSESNSSSSGSLNDGEYYFKTTLQAGRRYYFTTSGGTDEAPLSLDADARSNYLVLENTAAGVDSNNVAAVVYPSETDEFSIVVYGDGSGRFSLSYSADPAMPIGSHAATELTQANGYTAVITPGYTHDPSKDPYYDNIVDEVLCKASLEAGKNYIFETSGATTNLVLTVYDSTGKLDASKTNTGRGEGEFDVLAALSPSASGTFYFGVAQDIDELGITTESPEVPAYLPVSAVLREVTLAPDEVTPISAVPAVSSRDDPVEVDVEGVGPFVLDDKHWTKTFAIGVRSGITYRLKASTAERARVELNAEVFTKNGTKEEKVNSVSGSLDPTAGGLVISAPRAHNTYYVRVSVADGVGLTYPEFTMHCSAASSSGAPLGILQVDIKGAPGQWSINSESAKYDGGISILASGTNTVKFTKVAGFSQPANQVAPMSAGKTTTVVGVYSDTSDPKDDTAAGATKLTVSAKEVTAMRTLFAEDPEDNFTFAAKEGTYYNFALADLKGDAVFSITNAEAGVVCENETSVAKLQLPPSKLPYYLVVTHGNDVAEDGSYTLVCSSANVGAIKFAKTSISVKENAAYADVVVNRTAKEGAVRVRFGTVAGTAQPGSEYCPTNGILAWAANDNKAKTIRVKLIPDVTPTYEGDAKLFSVQLKALEEDELEDDEYPAQILTESAAVALTEVSKKTPGTISVTAYNGGDDDVAVTTPKKPTAVVTAGETLTLKLARSGGANGAVGVKVAVAKGTAVPDADFALASEDELVWADGDASEKTITIETYPAEVTGSYAESKTFTVKLAALAKAADGTAYDKPTLASASVAATINSDAVAASVETYAKGLAKTDGIALAGSKKGSWFIDDMGELRSVPLSANEKLTMTFTLTGPGFFKATPSLSDTDGGAYITAAAGKTEFGNVVDEDVAMIVPAGSTKVVFTVNAGSKAGVVTDGEALDIHASFAKFDFDDGSAPYFWAPLSSVAAFSPSDKGVAPATLGALEWDGPAALEDESGFFYRVSLDSDQKKLGTTNALFSVATQERSAPLGELALEPGKTYFWRVDYGYSDDSDANSISDWTVSKNVWSFSLAAASAPDTAVVSGFDATGAEIVPGLPVVLMQGVQASFAVGATNTESELSYVVLSGKLPDGLNLDAATGVVSGVPTKVGEYTAILQAKDGNVGGSSLALTFKVAAMTTAVGSFNGVFAEDGSALTNGLPAIGTVTFSATEAGKLSAKVALGGKNYTFAATGYDGVVDGSSEGDLETDYRTLAATLTQVQKAGTVVYTNTLEILMTDAATNNLVALGSAAGTFVLTMAVPDAKGSGVQEDVVFTGNLWRDNSKVPEVMAAQEAFVGYYTVALAPSGTSDEAPQGYGYLTLTVDAKGKVKVAGALADGTKASGSATAALAGSVSASPDNLNRELVVPFALIKSPYCLGGEIRIFLQEDEDGGVTPVVDSTAYLTWNNDDAAATYGGETGWRETVTPVGGWYNTIINLQAYYLNCTFQLDVSDDLPDELLADGYSFAASCSPNGMGVDVSGDTVSVEKKTLVKQEGSSTLVDLETSANPWDVKVSFKRATGIVGGTFSVWSEGTDARGNLVQKEIKSLKHDGVLILSRDTDAPIAEDVWTAGYYLAPVTLKSGTKTRKWNCSRPFSIRAVDQGEIDWWANDWGEPDGD